MIDIFPFMCQICLSSVWQGNCDYDNSLGRNKLIITFKEQLGCRLNYWKTPVFSQAFKDCMTQLTNLSTFLLNMLLGIWRPYLFSKEF